MRYGSLLVAFNFMHGFHVRLVGHQNKKGPPFFFNYLMFNMCGHLFFHLLYVNDFNNIMHIKEYGSL